MSELKHNKAFKEAVCIEAMRIFDSCSSQDCLEDLELDFCDPCAQELIDSASYIKTKSVEVTDVTFAIDPVPFNNGFYTVDLTYSFKVELEIYSNEHHSPKYVSGLTTFSKKVILYGSTGNTKRFSSDEKDKKKKHEECCVENNLPTAIVSVVDPIILDTKLVSAVSSPESKDVLVTIGIFSIVQLQRPVPLLIPVYDYCVPEKECSASTDSPCELFSKIQFPTNEFFPQGLESDDESCGCDDGPDDDSETSGE